ncbi:aldo/keto reductase [Nigerium sp.]|uniref:aldo/keto reductase n=1 Tax=Nigerium sp. TaxID=2042655 RepID=UPI003221AC39
MTAALPSPVLTLAGGVEIPQFGFGTYKIPQQDAERAVAEALGLGYRHVDTAAMYGNEAGVGRALAASGLPREELFVTSKLDNPYHEPDAARAAFERTMDDLGLDVLDLYLIHWPLPRTTDYVATWGALVGLLETGRVRAVGVSNFQPEHLRAIIDATGVVPAVNQIEVNPYLTQEPLRALHAELGIVTEAWSPLARGAVLDDPVLNGIAERLGKTVSQVVLRWHLQRGDVVFPKSTHPERMAENAGVFDVELSDEDVAAISGLNIDRRSGSSPDTVELKG